MGWILFTIAVTAVVTYGATVITRQFIAREKRIEHRVTHEYDVASVHFRRIMGKMLPPPIIGGNRIQVLRNGDEIFPAMLAAIRDAERTINFETFVYWSGEIAGSFANALAEQARAGLAVNVLIDWVGSKPMDPELIDLMRSAGADVKRYHKPKWYALDRLNQRTHRKLLIVDGRVGFTGGVGIADVWKGNAQDPQHWRDSHFYVDGPAVAQLQAAFLDNWLKTHDTILQGEEYFPALPAIADSDCQVFQSSAEGGSESVRLMYLLSLAAATDRILISSAYFIPDALTTRTLIAARRRGVTVQVIVPGPHIDKHVVRMASRAGWGSLLEAGVEIYEYQPTMYHTKVMVVDDRWTSVGSANFDDRSFRLNDEVNLNAIDHELAAALADQFAEDLQMSQRVTLEAWRKRPWRERIGDQVTELLRSQL
jgi:cardiolipin synthase